MDTALHIASALNRKAIVKSLLQWGADATLKNHVGCSKTWEENIS